MSEEREALREKLLSPRKNGYDRIKAEELQAMERYCGLYKTFLQQGKTERECARVAVELAEKAGFKPYERGTALAAGDKIYRVNRDKSVMLAGEPGPGRTHRGRPYRFSPAGPEA